MLVIFIVWLQFFTVITAICSIILCVASKNNKMKSKVIYSFKLNQLKTELSTFTHLVWKMFVPIFGWWNNWCFLAAGGGWSFRVVGGWRLKFHGIGWWLKLPGSGWWWLKFPGSGWWIGGWRFLVVGGGWSFLAVGGGWSFLAETVDTSWTNRSGFRNYRVSTLCSLKYGDLLHLHVPCTLTAIGTFHWLMWMSIRGQA